MNTTAIPHSIRPKYGPLPVACAITGLGRTKIYELAGKGCFKLVKAGGRTLVDIDSALEWLALQPAPTLRAPKEKKAA